MARSIGFGVERIGLAALRWPKIATALILAILVLIGASLSQLRFDDDINRVFLSDSVLSDAQRGYEDAQDPPIGTIIAYVQSRAPFIAADLTILRDITLDLEFIQGIAGVASPFVLRMPPDVGAPNGRPVFSPEITRDYGEGIAAFRQLGTGLSTFIITDQTALLIVVNVDLDRSSIRDVLPLLEAEFTKALPEGMSVTLTGEGAINLEIVSGLKADLIALNMWGALLVALAAFVLLRDVRMVLLAVIPALSGAVSILALSVWLGYPITVLSNVIPILLLVLGVADGVHLTSHLKTSRNDVSQTIRQIGPACALTALTTAAAFASIMITTNAQLFEFAVLGTIGTIFAFAIRITSFSLLALVIKLPDSPSPQFATGFAARFVGWGMAYPRAIAGLAIVLLMVVTSGYLQTKPWFPLYQNLPDGSPIVAANDTIAENFGGVFRMIVEVDNDWEKTQDLTAALADISVPGAVFSEANIARWLGTPDLRPTQEQLEIFPATLIKQLRPDKGTMRIFISTGEPMRSAATLQQFDRLFEAAKLGGADRIFGLPTVMRAEAVSLISQLSRALIIASLGATLLVAVAFRKLRLIPTLLVPNILPLMLTGASLHLWAQGELTPTAVLALTIAFGIAIDDSVHFLSRFYDARDKGETTRQALQSSTRSAGQAMVLTTLLLTVGLCVTQISGFTPIRVFGGMMIITLWAALLIDLLLLPALLSWRDRQNVRR